MLQKKEQRNELPFKLYKKNTISKYKKRFDWDARILAEMPQKTKLNQLYNSDHFHNELWELTTKYNNVVKKGLNKIDYTKIDPELFETEKIKNITKIHKEIDKGINTLHNSPIKLADIYAMIEVIQRTTKSNDDLLEETVDELLNNE